MRLPNLPTTVFALLIAIGAPSAAQVIIEADGTESGTPVSGPTARPAPTSVVPEVEGGIVAPQALEVDDIDQAGIGVLAPVAADVVINPLPKKIANPDLDGAPILRIDAGQPLAPVNAVAFSPDGNTLYAGGWDKVVHVWRRERADAAFTLRPEEAIRVPVSAGSAGRIAYLAMSPDGRYLAIAGQTPGRHEAGFRQIGLILRRSFQNNEQVIERNRILVRDLKRNTFTELAGTLGEVMQIAFAPDSRTLVSFARERTKGADPRGALRAWDVAAGKTVHKIETLPDPSESFPAAFAFRSAVGGRPQVALAHYNALVLWTPGRSGVQTVPAPSNYAVCPLPGNEFAFGTAANNVGLVKSVSVGNNTSNVQRTNDPATALQLASVDVAGSGPHLITLWHEAGENVTMLFDLRAKQYRYYATLSNASGVSGVARFGVDPTGRLLAAVAPDGTQIDLISLPDLVQGREVVTQSLIPPHSGALKAAFVTQGERLGLRLELPDPLRPQTRPAVLDLHKSVLSLGDAGWSPFERAVQPTLQPFVTERKVRALRATFPRGHASFPNGHSVVIQHLPDEVPLRRLFLPPTAFVPPAEDRPPLLLIAFRRQGEPILSVYRADNGERVRSLRGHQGDITSIAGSPDNSLVVTTSRDATVKVWSLQDLGGFVGRHGLLPGLDLKPVNGGLRVDEVDFSVAPDSVANAFREGDVILSLITPAGDTITLDEITGFVRDLWNTRPGTPLTVRVRGVNGAVRQTRVLVSQAVDERKPLFSIYVHRFAENDSLGFLAWSPHGPFESNTQQLERYVGWHTNTGDPLAPVTFSPLEQHRAQYFGKGLMKNLVAAHRVPDVWPPAPEPDLTLLIEQGGKPVLAGVDGVVDIKPGPFRVLLDLGADSGLKIRSLRYSHAGEVSGFQYTKGGSGLLAAELTMPTPDLAPSTIVRVNLAYGNEEIRRQEASLQLRTFVPDFATGLPRFRFVAPVEDTTVTRSTARPGDDQVTMQLSLAEAGTKPCRVLLLRDGQPTAAPPLEYKPGATEYRATINLVAGSNRFHLAVRNPDDRKLHVVSDERMVQVRTPPEVDQLTLTHAKLSDPQASLSATVTSILPLTKVQLQIGDRREKFVPVPNNDPDVKVTRVADDVYRIEWSRVPLEEGPNRIALLAFNADGPALDPPFKNVEFKPLATARNDLTIETLTFDGTGTEHERNVSFRVPAGPKLASAYMLFNSTDQVTFQIPPVKDGYYNFGRLVKFRQAHNNVLLVVTDVNNRTARETANISVVLADSHIRLNHVTTKADGYRKQFNIAEDGRAAQALPSGEVKLHGSVKVPEGVFGSGQTRLPLKIWVNGFLHTPEPLSLTPGVKEVAFETDVYLNRPTGNVVDVELVGVPNPKTDAIFDCEAPYDQQTLNAILISTAEADGDALANAFYDALEASDAPGAKRFAETQVLETVAGEVPSGEIKGLLFYLQSVSRPHDVALIYYEGGEVQRADGEGVLLKTADYRGPQSDPQRLISNQTLDERLTAIPGAHVMLLDIDSDANTGTNWPKFSKSGIVRLVRKGARAGLSDRLFTALPEAVDNNGMLTRFATAMRTRWKEAAVTISEVEFPQDLHPIRLP